MYSMIIRTTLMFLLVMIAVRIMGKKNLGEFQPSDFVSTILISNLTSIVIEAPELTLLYSFIPILLIVCYEVFMSVIVRKNEKIAKIAQGQAMVLIKEGVINQKVMARLRFTVDDVLEAMRGKDIFYLQEVNLAIVETTGAVNIYPDPNAKTNIEKAAVPRLPVITDGKINNDNLIRVGLMKEKLEAIIAKERVELKEILLLLVDGNEKYNLVLKEVK